MLNFRTTHPFCVLNLTCQSKGNPLCDALWIIVEIDLLFSGQMASNVSIKIDHMSHSNAHSVPPVLSLKF